MGWPVSASTFTLALPMMSCNSRCGTLNIWSFEPDFLVASTRHKKTFTFCHTGPVTGLEDIAYNTALQLGRGKVPVGALDVATTIDDTDESDDVDVNFLKLLKLPGYRRIPPVWIAVLREGDIRVLMSLPGKNRGIDLSFRFCHYRGARSLQNMEDLYASNGFGDGQILVFERNYLKRQCPSRSGDKKIIRKTPSLTVLQDFFDERLKGASLHDYSFDPTIVQDSNIVFSFEERVRINLSQTDAREKKYDRLIPQLRTHMPMCRNATMKETLLGLTKRNFAVPKLVYDRDHNKVVACMVANFVTAYIPKELRYMFEIFRKNLLYPNYSMLHDWSDSQKADLDNRVNPEYMMHDNDWAVYNFMIKPNPKPDLTLGGVKKYAAVQTIVYHDKEINCIMCPIMRQVKKRLIAVLNPKVKMFTDVSPDEFEKSLNETFDSSVLGWRNKLEVDISKYDKSQGELLLLAELEIYRMLGVPVDILNKWYHAHRNTTIVDRLNDIKCEIDFQRKSGNATTYIGNTLVLMLVLASLFDLTKAEMVLVSGDDSLIISKFPIPERSNECATIFNLESKFLRFKSTYFCSKFLISAGERIYLVPDPLKLLIKLGRRDLVNSQHVEEYRRSLVDLLGVYSAVIIDDPLQKAMDERYGRGNTCVSELLSTIVSFINSEENFSGLYSTFAGMRILTDPSLPALDV